MEDDSYDLAALPPLPPLSMDPRFGVMDRARVPYNHRAGEHYHDSLRGASHVHDSLAEVDPSSPAHCQCSRMGLAYHLAAFPLREARDAQSRPSVDDLLASDRGEPVVAEAPDGDATD